MAEYQSEDYLQDWEDLSDRLVSTYDVAVCSHPCDIISAEALWEAVRDLWGVDWRPGDTEHQAFADRKDTAMVGRRMLWKL